MRNKKSKIYVLRENNILLIQLLLFFCQKATWQLVTNKFKISRFQTNFFADFYIVTNFKWRLKEKIFSINLKKKG